MPAGASKKREREYQELKEEFKEEHRYPGREEEVAARIVNKQRAAAGETKEAKTRHPKPAARKATTGKSAARKTSKTSSRHTRH